MYVLDSFLQYYVNRGKVILLLVEAIGKREFIEFYMFQL